MKTTTGEELAFLLEQHCRHLDGQAVHDEKLAARALAAGDRELARRYAHTAEGMRADSRLLRTMIVMASNAAAVTA